MGENAAEEHQPLQNSEMPWKEKEGDAEEKSNSLADLIASNCFFFNVTQYL